MIIPNKLKRYQYQPWYIKIWRRRWYFFIPYNFFKVWLDNKDLKDYKNMPVFSRQICLDLAINEAHIKMKWL
jgi:hypothetical protein